MPWSGRNRRRSTPDGRCRRREAWGSSVVARIERSEIRELNPGFALRSIRATIQNQATESNAVPKTLFDKIWEFHRVGSRADGRELIYIDRHVLHELHAHHGFTHLEKQQRPVHRPDLTFAVQDHTVATKPGRDDDTNPSGTAFLKAMREGTRRNGIKLFDLGDPEQGISHVVAPELGIVL